jgi:hypothetical protein
MTWKAPLLTLSLLAALPPRAAWAGDTQACDRAYEQAQSLRDARKLTAARAQLRVCASAACPGFMVKDCAAWLGEIEARIPTVVMVANDGTGAALLNATVSMDAGARSFNLDGMATEVDPGPHTFTFVAPDGRKIDKPFLVLEGAKDQRVAVTFPAPLATPAAASPAVAPAAPDVASAAPSPSPFVPILLASVGVASVGVSFGVGAAAQSSANNLQHTCAPDCSSQSVSSVRTELIASDVLLGVGIAAVATAAVVFFVRRASHASASANGLVVAPSGVALSF